MFGAIWGSCRISTDFCKGLRTSSMSITFMWQSPPPPPPPPLSQTMVAVQISFLQFEKGDGDHNFGSGFWAWVSKAPSALQY